MTGRLLRNALRLSLLAAVAAFVAPVVTPGPAALAATPPGASAKGGPETALHRIQRMVAQIDAEAKTPEGEARVVSHLSAQLGVSADSLNAEHDAWGLGYGEIAMAYGFARTSRTGKTAADVVAMRNAGIGWLDIAKELRVKVDAVATRMNRHVGPKSKR